MAWRPHQFAEIDANNPNALGQCDRCSFIYNLKNLRFQFDWRGNVLTNLRIRVCPKCYDVPYQGNRPIKLPADPPPVMNARPITYAVEEEDGPPVPISDLVGV